MPKYSVWMLEESNISVSGGKSLDGITQGDGSHLVGETITLNANDWLETRIKDNDDDFDDNDHNQRLDETQTINGTTYAKNTKVEAEYRIVLQDGDGNTYEALAYNIDDSSPSYATVEGLSFVGPPQGWPPVGEPLTVTQATEGPGDMGQRPIDISDLVIPCFTPGTRIRTRDGEAAVEALRPGDMVWTQDRGAQPVRWIGRANLGPGRLAADPALRPVRLRAGALGPGRPRRDMLLSPQHRLLIAGWRAELLFGSQEVLAAARHLVNDRTITLAGEVTHVTYIHLLFDHHEILEADGLAAESFRPGPMTLPGMSEPARAELLALFPELAAGRTPALAPARPLLKGWEAAVLS